MPAQWTILVTNKTTTPQAFQLWSDEPSYSGVSTPTTTLPWGTSAAVPPRGFAAFNTTATIYAICGATIDNGIVIITTEDNKPAVLAGDSPNQLGSDFSMIVPPGKAPSFDMAMSVDDSAVLGGFNINSKWQSWDSKGYQNIYCGIARDIEIPTTKGIIPVSYFNPVPNMLYGIVPSHKMLVTVSPAPATVTGSRCDEEVARGTRASNAVEIDFTGTQYNVARVELGSDFTWGPVVYSAAAAEEGDVEGEGGCCKE